MVYPPNSTNTSTIQACLSRSIASLNSSGSQPVLEESLVADAAPSLGEKVLEYVGDGFFGDLHDASSVNRFVVQIVSHIDFSEFGSGIVPITSAGTGSILSAWAVVH
jgi:hypothetical protein